VGLAGCGGEALIIGHVGAVVSSFLLQSLADACVSGMIMQSMFSVHRQSSHTTAHAH